MRHPWNDPPDWQKDYFGRHVQLIPAENAKGYRFRPPVPNYVPFAGQQVQRAIPVHGTVQPPTPFDKPAPQVDLRMREPESRASQLGRKLRRMIKGRHAGKA